MWSGGFHIWFGNLCEKKKLRPAHALIGSYLLNKQAFNVDTPVFKKLQWLTKRNSVKVAGTEILILNSWNLGAGGTLKTACRPTAISGGYFLEVGHTGCSGRYKAVYCTFEVSALNTCMLCCQSDLFLKQNIYSILR
jgi:hypothetical protein